MTADKSITANFAPDQYTLTVTRAPEIPNGCVTTPTGSVLVGNGTAKSIMTTNGKESVASCGSGTVYLYYDFTGWSAVSGAPVFAAAGSASTTVTLGSGDATIKANYAPPRSKCE